MAKLTSKISPDSKLSSTAPKSVLKKGKKKRKSKHANTFEERQENRRLKEEKALNKTLRKEAQLRSKAITKTVIEDVTSWVKDNPLHPSTIGKPMQEGLIVTNAPKKYQRTYKAFIRNLPVGTTPAEIDHHFYSRANVDISFIRLLVQRHTGSCLGWGFLEFTDKLEYEKSLTLNVSRFNGKRILVEGSLRSFIPGKKRPLKLLTYKPPPKIKSKLNADIPDVMEIE